MSSKTGKRGVVVGREVGGCGRFTRLALGLLGLILIGTAVAQRGPSAATIGQIASGLLLTAALYLIGFPALALAWHGWRIRRHPARFVDTSLLSFALSVALPLALYFTWWYAPAFSVTSDAVLLFVGGSMVFAALRGSAGCELLALSNWLLRRCDQIACALLTPIDSLEQRGHTLV